MKYFAAYIIIFVLSLSVFGQSTSLMQGSVAIGAGQIWRVPFNIGTSGGKVLGRFRAEGGGRNDIFCYILSPDDFTNMQNGNEYRAFYESGRVTVANIDVPLPAGPYVLAFSNAQSVLTAKTVYGVIDAYDNRSPKPRPKK